MDDTSGPGVEDGNASISQHIALGAAITDEVNATLDTELTGEHVFCSRSGPPGQPWLEPDVNDRLEELAQGGVTVVVVAPIGFVSDHMEVVYDLDTEAMATARELGIACERAATAGVDPRFVAMVRELVLERAAVERGVPTARKAEGGLPACWDRCSTECCRNLQQGPRPTVGGVEDVDA
jgi:ferrochelatase